MLYSLAHSRFSVKTLLMTAALSIVVLIAAMHPVAVAGQADDSEGWDTKVAVAEYNAGHYDAAIALFTKILKSRHSFVDSNFNRALCYEAKKEWLSAITDFDIVIVKRPKLYDAYVERSRCNREVGELRKAEEDLLIAIDLKPERSDAYELQGDLRVAYNDYDNAIKAYTHYFDTTAADAKARSAKNSPDPLVYQKRGMAYLSAKNYEAAAEDFDRFIALDPRDAASSEAYLSLGDAYTAL